MLKHVAAWANLPIRPGGHLHVFPDAEGSHELLACLRPVIPRRSCHDHAARRDAHHRRRTGRSRDAYHLQRLNRSCLIVDGNEQVGDNWRQQWDSLRLYTPAKYDGLPVCHSPRTLWSFPQKDEVADYLESYALHWDLPVRTSTRVETVEAGVEGGYSVSLGGDTISCDNVVVATGTFGRTPYIPSFAQELDASITQLHSSEYRRPSQLQPGKVLVVGASHSGTDIAFEVALTHKTILCGRDCGQIPVRLDSGDSEPSFPCCCSWLGMSSPGARRLDARKCLRFVSTAVQCSESKGRICWTAASSVCCRGLLVLPGADRSSTTNRSTCEQSFGARGSSRRLTGSSCRYSQTMDGQRSFAASSMPLRGCTSADSASSTPSVPCCCQESAVMREYLARRIATQHRSPCPSEELVPGATLGNR